MKSFVGSALLSVALVVSACSKDAQTEEAVKTKTSGGEASMSISGDSADKRGQALVRVVNAAASAPMVTVRADEMHALPSVNYKEVSAYHPIDRNWATFQINGSVTNSDYAPLETNREMLTDGHRYTIVVMREDDGAGFTTRVVRDDISSDMTQAHLRVIHAASGIDEVNVIAKGGEKLFGGVNFRSEAGFKDVPPWTGALEIRTEDGNRLLVTTPKLNLQAGKSYTVVLARAKGGKTEAFWFEDALAGQ